MTNKKKPVAKKPVAKKTAAKKPKAKPSVKESSEHVHLEKEIEFSPEWVTSELPKTEPLAPLAPLTPLAPSVIKKKSLLKRIFGF